jgi:TonB-dependent starch-binding outer membrane protein SusC
MKTIFTKHFMKVLLLFVILLMKQNAGAQTLITGRVLSDEGEPLPGTSVVIKGTTLGTTTDTDGHYSVQAPGAESILVFSFVGYSSQEVIVGARSKIDVTMVVDIASLQEIVVIGYGTQRAGDVTGAITRVNAKDFQVGKIQDATDLIKGKVPGLVITKSSGDPNETSNIMLRGITTLQGDVKPLILVNGVPTDDLSVVAPENIESVDVLKDASAAAIYGTRGANGVILITTKSGARDKPVSVNYTGYVSVSDFYKQADFMGPNEIRHGLTAYSDEGWDTDWVKSVTRKGYTQNHSLTIDGGSRNSAYSANISYRNEAGTIKNTDNDRYRVQLNLDQYLIKDIVKLNLNILKEYHTNTVNTASAGDLNNIYRQAVIRNPTSSIYDEATGEYTEDFNRFQYFNPVSMLNELDGTNEDQNTNLIGNITIEPIDRWKTNLMLASNLYNQNFSSYATSKYYSSITSGFPGSAYKAYNQSRQKTLELTTAYDFSINDHRISALAGYSYYYWLNDGFNAGNSDFPSDSYGYNNIGLGARLKTGNAGMDSYKDDATLVSFFGRLQYAFSDKYNVLASLRQEGSSKFGSNHQWGLFPAVSAGWTISKENFMSSVSFVDNLKLRAGYGVTGRSPASSYKSLTLFNYDPNYGNFLNKDGEWIPGLMVTQNPNPDLKWETTAEVNMGLDFGLFGNRLKGSVDVYTRETSDLIYDYNVPVPPNLHGQTQANVGSLKNKGIEVMLGGTPVRSQDFEWNTTVTITRNKAELVNLSNDLYETNDYVDWYSIGDPISVPSHRWKEGELIGNFWGLKSVGLTEDGLWLIEDPTTGEAIPYSTSLNSNTYRQVLGNGYPKVYLGWNNTFRYKGFDLNVQMTGQFGFKILNQQRMFYENNSIQYNKLKTATDDVYGVAPLSTSQAQAFVSYYLEDGAFLKFDNATLGYNFNLDKVSQHLANARIYTSAQNFLIITGYKGLDPELANSDIRTPGSDYRDKYPTIRSFTLGLNVTFK